MAMLPEYVLQLEMSCRLLIVVVLLAEQAAVEHVNTRLQKHFLF
jgi:hypothetical protein